MTERVMHCPLSFVFSHHSFTHFFPMGTRSRIGLQLEGQIISAYHHWDGYPEWLGVTLNKKFNTRELVEELIDGGDMSCCDSDSDWDLKQCESHVQYYSLRGEDTPPRISESITEFFDHTENCDGEYAYLFNNGEWTCYDMGGYGSRAKGTILDIPAEYPVRETV